MMPGVPARTTHDYIRYGTTSLHFTPTSASWLNLVVRWFAELTNRKTFIWTKTADEILANYRTQH
jgi:hypothetical protein